MEFDPRVYGEDVAAILALDGGGRRLMPLEKGRCSSDRAYSVLKASPSGKLFSGARAPEAAMSGLFLYFSCLDEAHEIAQEVHTPEGSFWHAIMHRQEPDAGNSGYWFNRVGAHAIFPALRDAAAEIGVNFGARWNPHLFIDFCERARRQPGSELERQALEVQLAEWQLLVDHCARPSSV